MDGKLESINYSCMDDLLVRLSPSRLGSIESSFLSEEISDPLELSLNSVISFSPDSSKES